MKIRLFNREGRRPKKPKSKRTKIIITVIFICIAIASPFILWGILQLSLGTHMPITVVSSGSMEPALYKGDLVFLQGKNPADIKNGTIDDKNGDIIVFNTHGIWGYYVAEPVIHRVIDKRYTDQWEFYTKGDNNVGPDGWWMPEDHIIGVVCGVIPKIGWIKLWFYEANWLVYVVVGLLLFLIISIIWDVIKEKEEDEEKDKKLFIEKNNVPEDQTKKDNSEGIKK